MRKLTLLILVATAAVTLQTGVALAGSVGLTLRGTRHTEGRGWEIWYLWNRAGRLAGDASLVCVQGKCDWRFTFRPGSFYIRVRHRRIRAHAGMTATVYNGSGAYRRDKGTVHITFVTAKRARFSFHLKR